MPPFKRRSSVCSPETVVDQFVIERPRAFCGQGYSTENVEEPQKERGPWPALFA